MAKITRYLLELKKWIYAGRPTRTDEKIKELFQICSSNQCGQYIKKNEQEGNCNICGCRLTQINEHFNKLAWATTQCPHDPPFWISEKEYKSIFDNKEREEIDEEVSEEELRKIEEKVEKIIETMSSNQINSKNEEIKEVQQESPPTQPKKRGGCGCH